MSMSPTQKGALGTGIGIAATVITDCILRYAVDATPKQDETTKEITIPVLYEYAPLFAALGGGLGVGVAWLSMGKEAGVPAIVGATGAAAAIGIDSWVVVAKAKAMAEAAKEAAKNPLAIVECPEGQHKDAAGNCVAGAVGLGQMLDFKRLAARVAQVEAGAVPARAAGVRL